LFGGKTETELETELETEHLQALKPFPWVLFPTHNLFLNEKRTKE